MSIRDQKKHTEVEIVFFPSVARIRHLYSIASPAVVILFLFTLDFKDAKTLQEWKALIRRLNITPQNRLRENNGMQIIHTSFKSNPNRTFLGAALKHAGEFIKKRVWL